MSVSSVVECVLPFCDSPKEQTDFSRNLRITTVVLGVILLIVGVALLAGALGNFNSVPGGICVAIGLMALVLGSCVRCVKDEIELNSPISDDTVVNQPVHVQHIEAPSRDDLRQTLQSLSDASSRQLDKTQANYQKATEERAEFTKKVGLLQSKITTIFSELNTSERPTEIASLQAQLTACWQTLQELNSELAQLGENFKMLNLNPEKTRLSQIHKFHDLTLNKLQGLKQG